jgi:RNA polymerase sigma-70 factor (ECF subfamily)
VKVKYCFGSIYHLHTNRLKTIFMVLMATNDVRQRVFESEFLPELAALYGFAYHLTYDEAAAEDLVQDTIERAIKAIDQYRQGTNAKAWLFKIMRNHFINGYRKKARRPGMVDYEDVAAIIPDTGTQNVPSVMDWEDDQLETLVGDELLVAMGRLSADFRMVIILSDLQDFKYEEIAEILDVPIGTIRSRLFRARNLLAKDLKDYAEANGYHNNRNKDS